MKNCADWQQEIAGDGESPGLDEHLENCERCREFAAELEKNIAALREFTAPAAAFVAVRQRVLSGIHEKKRWTVWWTWSAAAAATAATCIALLCVSLVPPNPSAPMPIVAKKDPPKIEWTPRSVRHTNSGRYLAQARPVRKTEPLAVVKMLTDDPNVIIIWLVDQKGDSL